LNKIKWIIFAVASITILGLLIGFSRSSKVDVGSVDINAIQVASDKNGNIAEHVYGNPDSKVILINYGDFQCPGCGTAHPRIKAIVEEYKDRIQFVFRNFPLTAIHANAKAASATAEAASLQGKYWQMHDKIYENQSEWSSLSIDERTNTFVNYAKDFGLDIDKFSSDLASESIKSKINYDKSLGEKAKVEGTPSFFLNGTKLESTIWGDSTKLKEALDNEIAKNL